MQITELGKRLYVDLGLHPNLVPHGSKTQEHDRVKVLELGIADCQVFEIEVLMSACEHSGYSLPESGPF